MEYVETCLEEYLTVSFERSWFNPSKMLAGMLGKYVEIALKLYTGKISEIIGWISKNFIVAPLLISVVFLIDYQYYWWCCFFLISPNYYLQCILSVTDYKLNLNCLKFVFQCGIGMKLTSFLEVSIGNFRQIFGLILFCKLPGDIPHTFF